MWKLLAVFIFSLVAAFLSKKTSVYQIGENGTKTCIKKDKFFFLMLVLVLAFFVGLRTNYNDTTAYTRAYELKSTSLSSVDWAIGSNPGFQLCNIGLKLLGVSTQSFLMFYAFLTICIYLWFIRKYAEDFLFSMFLFGTMGCYVFTMAAIKQCVAVAFCMIATDRAIRKKWVGFVFWTLLASTFHPYSLMYLAIPLLTFSPWTKKTYWMLAAFGAAGIGLQGMLGRIVNITSMLGEEYSASSFAGDGVNFFRVAVVWVPVILSFLVRDRLRENNNRASNLIMNLTMLNAEIMFIGLFGTANYFARLANYFLLFQAISLPWLLKQFDKRSKPFLYLSAVIGYLLYFFYENGVLYGGFDSLYKMISFSDYLGHLF